MSYKYKLNFYDVRDLKLFPKVLTEFVSSVIIAMVPDEPDRINNFVLYVDLNKNKAIIKSCNDFRDSVSEFETNGLEYEYYEDDKDREVIKENEDGESMYTLDISPLTSNKLRTIVIQDLIESIDSLAIGDQGYYDTYDAFLSSIEFDMLNSKITLRSNSSLRDSIKNFNNNGLPYKYYSTLRYYEE